MNGQLGKAGKTVASLLAEKGKLEEENGRLTATADKLEIILLRNLQMH